MSKENRMLLVTGVICALGCLFIAVYNSAQAAFLSADVIPASEYTSAMISSEAESSEQTDDSDSDKQKTININTATAEELDEALPGIGETKAKRIVEYREAAGGFDSVDELINVSGIGEKTLENLRPYCRVTD